MNNKKTLGQEKPSLLKQFPLVENENYLLKMTSGTYAIARWSYGKFNLDYDPYHEIVSIEEEIKSIVSLKELLNE